MMLVSPQLPMGWGRAADDWPRPRETCPLMARLAVQGVRSGYFDRMARPRRPESALVPIGLEVTEMDAVRIDQVLARPEFAGWTRADWCLEIIRTALRYYGSRPVREPGHDRGPARPAAAEPVSAAHPPPRTAARSQVAAVSPPDQAAPQRDREPVPAAPEPPSRPECLHPAEARDYQTGTCAACGAILWD